MDLGASFSPHLPDWPWRAPLADPVATREREPLPPPPPVAAQPLPPPAAAAAPSPTTNIGRGGPLPHHHQRRRRPLPPPQAAAAVAPSPTGEDALRQGQQQLRRWHRPCSRPRRGLRPPRRPLPSNRAHLCGSVSASSWLTRLRAIWESPSPSSMVPLIRIAHRLLTRADPRWHGHRLAEPKRVPRWPPLGY